MFEIDLLVGVSVFLQFDWLVFLPSFFLTFLRKGREAGLTIKGEEVLPCEG